MFRYRLVRRLPAAHAAPLPRDFDLYAAGVAVLSLVFILSEMSPLRRRARVMAQFSVHLFSLILRRHRASARMPRAVSPRAPDTPRV